MTDQIRYTIKPLSENSLVLYFSDHINAETTNQITSLNTAIRSAPFRGFIESVPAYVSLTLFYDPFVLSRDKSLPGNYAFEKVTAYLQKLEYNVIALPDQKELLIPVCYDRKYAPDIEEVALHANISIKEVIYLHSKADYLVCMLGFMPGFPYLAGLPEKLNMKRKANPRKIVVAGSVAIAGAQTGIYPLNSPGGWQIIGRTPLCLFDATNNHPALLSIGTKVKFTPITSGDFEVLIN